MRIELMTAERAMDLLHDFTEVMGHEADLIQKTAECLVYKIEAGKQTIELHIRSNGCADMYVTTYD